MNLRHPTMCLLLLLFVCPGRTACAQENVDSPALPVADRAWIASKIYSSIQIYFAHWEAIPDFNLDQAYREYLAKAMASDDRRQFDLASMEFLAKLHNGHSDFHDDFLFHHFGQPLGFAATLIQGKWVVTQSRLDALKPGDVLQSIDGRPADQFFLGLQKYVSASDDSALRDSLFYMPYLFPQSFKITLQGGKEILVDREHKQLQPAPPTTFEAKLLPGDIGYLQIPTFGDPKNQDQAVAFLKEHPSMKAVVLDVRRNGGGNTPTQLIKALMDRPYRSWNESTSLSIGLFAAYAQIGEHASEYGLDAESKAYMGAFQDYFSRPHFSISGSVTPPDHPIFTGPLFVLAGAGCASACEDFLMPLKTTGRATIIGQKTEGTSGQPFLFNFANGMLVRISSKRMYFPNGGQFEGVGIKPDVEIVRSIADWKSGNDPELERALQLAKGH